MHAIRLAALDAAVDAASGSRCVGGADGMRVDMFVDGIYGCSAGRGGGRIIVLMIGPRTHVKCELQSPVISPMRAAEMSR